ncbi:hypothetical protein [Clostridium sp.]|uniref:hypothetical protein n=1 Tax=Clostridium sp. TaxID=1506 RepID=UPI002FC5E3AF
MPLSGSEFTIQLKATHLNWGTYRYSDTRRIIYDEMYLPIPSNCARAFSIYNSNYTNRRDVLGINIFNCISSDGFLNCSVKAAGSSTAGDIYAKNLQGNGDLKLLAPWATSCQMRVGDSIHLLWIDEETIRLTHIPQ